MVGPVSVAMVQHAPPGVLLGVPDDAEPDASTEGTHIAVVVGENGFKKDAEGVTIYYARDGGGYMIV